MITAGAAERLRHGQPKEPDLGQLAHDRSVDLLGAVVLADTRRLADCFSPIDFFEDLQLPYVVGLNCFDGEQPHGIEEVRDALAIGSEVPIMLCDARNRESVKQTLITMVEYAMDQWVAKHGAGVS